MNQINFLMSLSIVLSSCQLNSQSPADSEQKDPEFNKYWYAGEAELSRYELKQARYGEIREGEAVLIYVTEEFRTDRQVKYEGGERRNVVPILKLNRTKKFSTGLYPYSIMTSVFTPTDVNDNTIKVSASIQEWCGHTYSQLNNRKGKYQYTGHSYFASEADEDIKIPAVALEDELWTQARLEPKGLPQGKIQILPSLVHLRLKHIEGQAYEADASLDLDEGIYTYNLDYKTIDRKLILHFEEMFPHRIISWEEHEAGLVTSGKRTHDMKSSYWTKNKNSDSQLKVDLGLMTQP